ncbi:isoleucine-tRNA ligase, variant 1 [Aphanomyces astaci]|uniref:isoleucine--tRNA ligase n=1 Tax=Aphanomyces astaci TaxID=112090 RepID=W4GKJ5_APHAT|nr:isoleucine-tRNA ligase, variant 1 [Aphanomyces astaci]ETV79544.1 isoleucine-tRNA ligase, variant 1 [Aphanomyces astaci]|eukprot:XP_009830480.1 isoleucine-tRNA ligase, variant 1 [Aphanomyces astaci]
MVKAPTKQASVVGDVVRKTLNLPKTDFPMRANATVREPQLHARTVTELYATQEKQRKGVAPTFFLHDGPPFANGSLHTGHFLNRVLKDIINRYKLQRGYHVHYVPGWDCHGLPIEIKALEKLKLPRDKLDPIDIRKHSRALALDAVESQKKDLMRWGVLADWSGGKGTRYLTMDPDYEVRQYDVFKSMVKDGLIVQGYKPVYWSPSSGTALAESELEYQDDHVSSSAYVRFPVKSASAALAAFPNIAAVIWTTTPWTIPANRGLCVRSDLEYAIVEVAPGQLDLVAVALVDEYKATLNQPVQAVATVWGADLVGSIFSHPLNGQDSIVLLGDHVTTDAGTGVVHTAPAHGQEDYFAWMAHHAQHHSDNTITCLVDEKGCYTAEAGADLAGLFVQTQGTAKVLEQLAQSGALVSVSEITHRFPYDWRTKKPILLRATKQWFAKLDSLHALGHQALDSVNMHPKASRRRLEATLSSRSEWCISRQRAWGVPIPVFYDKDTLEPLLNDTTISHVQKVMLERGGTDAWWTQPLATLLAPGFDPAQYVKGTDTLDVWFDSGSSWYAVLPKDTVADVYLEGSDQHRGWFQSSLLTSLAVQRTAPYKNVITHGFILDERGQKMSKSLGNVLVPHDIIEGHPKKKIPAYGVDTLRYWVASTDYTSQVGIGPSTMVKISDHVRKVRNTARFLLANLNDFDPRVDAVAYDDMTSLDQYMLHLLHELQAQITDGYETFAFNKVQQALAHFIATDLSAFYMEACKDRLYCEAPTDPFRRSAQTVLDAALQTITTAIAPVVCHTAEDIRLHRLAQFTNAMVNDVPGSVFLDGWFSPKPEWHNAEVVATWEVLRSLRLQVNRTVEQLREQGAIKTTMECNIDVHTTIPVRR